MTARLPSRASKVQESLNGCHSIIKVHLFSQKESLETLLTCILLDTDDMGFGDQRKYPAPLTPPQWLDFHISKPSNISTTSTNE